ncbi:MAG: hypothetical protein LUF35_12350 [Lachnospiraceae bacterium]|nr:hypothetical protein [Lachnospiraceae bacterium]
MDVVFVFRAVRSEVYIIEELSVVPVKLGGYIVCGSRIDARVGKRVILSGFCAYDGTGRRGFCRSAGFCYGAFGAGGSSGSGRNFGFGGGFRFRGECGSCE